MQRPRENFPVASRLIRAELRPAVLAFYDFARMSDDIADDPARTSDDKLAALEAMAAGLDGHAAGAPVAVALHRRLDGGPLLRHAHRLLDAFRQDSRGAEYRTWDDLAAYCEASANPVGRFLLELHGEEPRHAGASDAICTALQVLNHVQDIGVDRARLGRVYLPRDWRDAAGVTDADLTAPALSPALREVVDRCLDRCDALLAAGAGLPRALRGRRLAGEVRAILRTGDGLARQLRHADPLAGRPRPGAADFAAAGLAGLVEALGPRPAADRRPRPA